MEFSIALATIGFMYIGENIYYSLHFKGDKNEIQGCCLKTYKKQSGGGYE